MRSPQLQTLYSSGFLLFALASFGIFAPSARAATVYIPLFQATTTLATTTGSFAIAPGGGLTSSTAGVTAKGYIDLPQIIDPTKAWRFAVLFQWNGDNINSSVVQLMASSTVANNNLYGVFGGPGSDGYMDFNIGGSALYHQQPLVLGQKYWMTVASDGYKIYVSTMPYGNYVNLSNITYLGASTTVFYSGESYQVNGFTNLQRLLFQTNSTSTQILGVYVNEGSTAGTTSDSRLEPPGLVNTSVGADNTVRIRLPPNYDGITPTDIVYVDHPNASDENWGFRTNDPDGGVAFASLLNAGYIVVSGRGDPNSYTSASSSPWGAPGPLATRKAILDYVKANYGPIRNVYWIGQSMGLLDGLNYVVQYPGSLQGIVGISGVTNVSDMYVNGGYSSTINTAYGTTSLSYISQFDPNLNSAKYSHTPISLWHGTADAVVNYSTNPVLFQSNVQSAGGLQISVNPVAGSDHLQSPSLWNSAGLQALFTVDTTPPNASVITPTANSTLTGSDVTLTATASDNIGVTGIQFKVDGASTGAVGTSSPFSIVWNSTGVPDGTHIISAIASDAAGNTATSSVSVTITNAVAYGGGSSSSGVAPSSGGGFVITHPAVFTVPTPSAPCALGKIFDIQTGARCALSLATALGIKPQSEAPIAFLFSKDLQFGRQDAQIKWLQEFLNDAGYSVASSGSGSPGNESVYFGSLTRHALELYQAAHNITPAAGYFGPLTRAYIASHEEQYAGFSRRINNDRQFRQQTRKTPVSVEDHVSPRSRL
jgi:hypothetical protein